jgi:ABC-type Fe3+ transport system permease subunit
LFDHSTPGGFVIALALLVCIVAFIVGLIIKAAEIATEAGTQIVRKSSDFAHYVKNTWEETDNAS